MRITTGFNKMLAVEPPEQKAVEKKIVSGIASAVHRVALVRLKVVFDSEDRRILAGSNVYVVAGVINSSRWAQEVYESNDLRFVLMPESQIVLVEYEALDYSVTVPTVTITSTNG